MPRYAAAGGAPRRRGDGSRSCGASLCAVRDGRSVDTSMGLTPLEGLVMSTRSGNVDPGLVLHQTLRKGMSSPRTKSGRSPARWPS